MTSVHIRCYHPNATTLQPHVFYILAKGDNAGKPAFVPWVNSFMAICQNRQMFEFYFWLTYGLWTAGKFKTLHRGSAIQFVNVVDVRSVIGEVAPPIYEHWQQYQQILGALSKLEQKKASLAEQIV